MDTASRLLQRMLMGASKWPLCSSGIPDWKRKTKDLKGQGAVYVISGPFGGRVLVGQVFDHTVCAVDPYGP